MPNMPTASEAWDKTKTGSKKGFDKVWKLADKLGTPANKLSNKFGSESFWPTTLDKESDKAARILMSFCKHGFQDKATSSTDKALKKIPKSVIAKAKGLAIFTTMRTGLWVSGAGGSGVLVARQADGSWSPPSGIMVHTNGLGFLVGVDIYDCVLVITKESALEAFTKVRITLGGEMSVVAGPLGAGGSVDTELHTRQAPILSYLKSRGFYAGVQVEGTIIIERTDENERFYGERIGVMDILTGKARHPPPEIKPFIETIRFAQGDSDIDHSLLPNEPAPGDYEVEEEKSETIFGIPDFEDPDPFGVHALEKEGFEIREAGTGSRPPSEQFEYRPSPTSPIFNTFNRRSIDTYSRRTSDAFSIRSRGHKSTNSVDRGVQTEPRSEFTEQDSVLEEESTPGLVTNHDSIFTKSSQNKPKPFLPAIMTEMEDGYPDHDPDHDPSGKDQVEELVSKQGQTNGIVMVDAEFKESVSAYENGFEKQRHSSNRSQELTEVSLETPLKRSPPPLPPRASLGTPREIEGKARSSAISAFREQESEDSLRQKQQVWEANQESSNNCPPEPQTNGIVSTEPEDEFSDLDDEAIEDEHVEIHEPVQFHQPTHVTPQIISKPRLVTIAKRLPPALPPRSAARGRTRLQGEALSNGHPSSETLATNVSKDSSPLKNPEVSVEAHDSREVSVDQDSQMSNPTQPLEPRTNSPSPGSHHEAPLQGLGITAPDDSRRDANPQPADALENLHTQSKHSENHISALDAPLDEAITRPFDGSGSDRVPVSSIGLDSTKFAGEPSEGEARSVGLREAPSVGNMMKELERSISNQEEEVFHSTPSTPLESRKYFAQ